MKLLKTAALGLALVAGPAFADGHASGDAEAGEKVFKKCKACHSIVDAGGEVIAKGGRNGPNLYGVLGRQAGTEAEFGKKFGKSIVAAGEAGVTWDEEQFIVYVADPRQFLRTTLDNKKAKTKMSFKLGNAEDAANVWAYLVSVGPAAE
ncbi:MAG: c-type cytochrome [Sulfitobacter sp.]